MESVFETIFGRSGRNSEGGQTNKKVVIEREELLRGIGAVLDLVPSKTALPVLSNIKIEAEDGGGLRLSATDLDVSIKCTLSATVDVSGSTTVPDRQFSEIVREVPEEEVYVRGLLPSR